MVHEGVVGLQREQLTNSHTDTYTHSSLVPRRSKKSERSMWYLVCICASSSVTFSVQFTEVRKLNSQIITRRNIQ